MHICIIIIFPDITVERADIHEPLSDMLIYWGRHVTGITVLWSKEGWKH